MYHGYLLLHTSRLNQEKRTRVELIFTRGSVLSFSVLLGDEIMRISRLCFIALRPHHQVGQTLGELAHIR